MRLQRNSVFIYIASRYGTYFLQFISSLFIANTLGPENLGIWGFFSLLFLYSIQLNFGVPQATGNFLAVNYQSKKRSELYFTNSLTLLTLISFFFILLLLLYYGIGKDIGSNFNLAGYFWIIIICGSLNLFVVNFSNLYRVYGNLTLIAISQSLPAVLNLIAVIFIDKSNLLLDVLMLIQLMSLIFSLSLFVFRTPIRLSFSWKFTIVKEILRKGFYLFLYNIAFYLILISSRTFVSYSYSVEEFGYFTFAFSLGNTIFLLLESLNYLVYPKLINIFHNMANDQSLSILKVVRSGYSLLTFLIAFLSCIIIPFFLLLFPDYNRTDDTFRIIVLAIGVNSTCFGFNTFLISKGKERIVAKISGISLFVNIVIAYVIVFVLNKAYYYVFFSTLIAFSVNSMLLVYFGRQEICSGGGFISVLKDAFSYKIYIPLVINLLVIAYNLSPNLYILSFVLFILFNYREFVTIYKYGKKFLKNESLFNIT